MQYKYNAMQMRLLGQPKPPHVEPLTRPQSQSRRQGPEKMPTPGQVKLSPALVIKNNHLVQEKSRHIAAS